MFKGAENGLLPSGERLNCLGYRGRAPSVLKGPDEFRIFVVGGSTVFAGETSIPDLLQKEFDKRGFNNVKVYNFGVVSSVSGQEISRILFEISDFKPDLIVMYNGNNDIMQPYYMDPRPGYPLNFIVYENNPVLSDVRSYPRLTLLLYGSNLLRHLFPNYFVRKLVPLRKLQREARHMSREWKGDIIKTYVKNLAKAAKISKAFGAEFIAFFQPTIYSKKYLSPGEEKRARPDEKEYYKQMRQRTLAELRRLEEAEPITIVDLSDIYADIRDTVFSDPVHTYQESKTMVAEQIFQNIIIRCPIRKNEAKIGAI
ncbi:MAG: SGNH/GDSL hydrolase family protein [Candidatus Omnitrophica bacterium]|nr:SGNH/GDSL hydrolase family protein [Candidatus Omnitrophota bacterium]